MISDQIRTFKSLFAYFLYRESRLTRCGVCGIIILVRKGVEKMGKCRFLLIRHGESEGNHMEMFLGHTDLDLTELGHRQAECTAEYLKDTPIDVVYSSDLRRAWQTAEHIAARHGLSIIADTHFREAYAGVWEGMKYSEINEKYPHEFEMWRTALGKAYCVGGESVPQVLERVQAEIMRLAELNDGKLVCVATHATPVRVMRSAALGLDLENAKPVGPANASVTVIDVEDGKMTLISDGYDEHLKGLSTLPEI